MVLEDGGNGQDRDKRRSRGGGKDLLAAVRGPYGAEMSPARRGDAYHEVQCDPHVLHAIPH